MIYICGDSFGVSDAEWGQGWMDILSKQLNTVNLSRVCASNLLIAQQVDQAIDAAADFIIVLCTASTRSQTRLGNTVVPYSLLSLDETTPFNQRQLQILRDHTLEFFDLTLSVYENQLIIEAMLTRLQDSKIPFVFDQGGFEHASYGGHQQYFTKFNQYRSSINLWDYAEKRSYRPYHHIDNPAVHETIANYYKSVYNSSK